MKCPNCEKTLVMAERSGIEIDYCPDCRGVWLDRGELDKIVERNRTESAPAEAPRLETRDPREEEKYRYEKKYRKRSFLEDLFD